MKKILIIQTAFPGDAILTLPMIQTLWKNNPDCIIDVIAIPTTSDIFSSSPYVSNVIVYDKRGKNKSVLSLLKFASDLRKNKYDVLYSPHRSFRTALIVLLSRVKDSYGFDISSLSWVYKSKVKYERSFHEVKRNLSLIGKSEIDWMIKPQMNLPDPKNLLQNIPTSELVALAPGSVWETKKYPVEKFRQIVSELCEKKYFILLLGGKDDHDLCEKLNIMPNTQTMNLAGKLSIIESTSVLTNCKLLISNDSAPTHMGMAADIPVLTIYCSTIPGFGFYPYNSKSFSLTYNDLECKPCGIHGHQKCPEGTFECAHKLNPSLVMDKIMEILGS